MVIEVFGKKGCGLCEAAKAKLKRMQLEFKEHELEWHTAPHDGWRNDATVELMTARTLYDTLPLIRIEDRVFDYPGAMRELKRISEQWAAAGN